MCHRWSETSIMYALDLLAGRRSRGDGNAHSQRALWSWPTIEWASEREFPRRASEREFPRLISRRLLWMENTSAATISRYSKKPFCNFRAVSTLKWSIGDSFYANTNYCFSQIVLVSNVLPRVRHYVLRSLSYASYSSLQTDKCCENGPTNIYLRFL